MLISSIIHNMFFHSFQIDKWSKLVLDVITSFICNFFGKKGKETKIDSSYLEGFLSLIGGGRSQITRSQSLNEAMLRKFSQKVIIGYSSMLLYLCKWYFDKEESPQSYYVFSFIWLGLRPHCLTIFKESRGLVNKNSSVQFWIDNWLNNYLIEKMNNPLMNLPIRLLVGDYI